MFRRELKGNPAVHQMFSIKRFSRGFTCGAFCDLPLMPSRRHSATLPFVSRKLVDDYAGVNVGDVV